MINLNYFITSILPMTQKILLYVNKLFKKFPIYTNFKTIFLNYNYRIESIINNQISFPFKNKYVYIKVSKIHFFSARMIVACLGLNHDCVDRARMMMNSSTLVTFCIPEESRRNREMNRTSACMRLNDSRGSFQEETRWACASVSSVPWNFRLTGQLQTRICVWRVMEESCWR